jgi:uncharacterized protein YkwD
MLKLAWIRVGIGVVGLSTASLSGCAWVPVWPDRASAQPGPGASPAGKDLHEFDPKTACADVVKAHNRMRADAKLPALAVSAKLREAARQHAQDMAAHGKMSHKGSDGSSAIDRISAQGYQYRRAGENIAVGHFTTDELMKGWMNSPPHKRNILGSFSQIGVAYATAENGKRYWCVTFGLPARR